MKVKATKIGFYGKLQRVGEVFIIKDEKELGSWMEEVKEVKKVKTKVSIKK